MSHAGGSSRVHLRLRADGQVLELPLGKTTIGSSPKCNVRIQQPGVQPLHCLIVHAPAGLRIRSWAGNTTLNGVPFQESALGLGDCLSVGPVELDVVDPHAGAAPADAVEAPVANTEVAGEIRAGRDLARNRGRRLLATLRRQRAAYEQLQQQATDLQEAVLQAIEDGNGLGGTLENTKAQLAAARKQLAEQEALGARRDELARRNKQLEREVSELSVRVDQLTHDQATSDQDHTNENAALNEQHKLLADVNSQLQNDIERLTNENAAQVEQYQRLVEANSQLRNEVGQLSNQKSTLSGERDELRQQNEQLIAESRALAAERAAISDERNALANERNELQLRKDELQARLSKLHEENSAMAVAKLAVVDQCDILSQQIEQFQSRIAELSEENSSLVAAKAALCDEQTALRNEIKRLMDLEREMHAALASRESASDELYRALLQLAEMQERDIQNKAVITAFESLSDEHEQSIHEIRQIKEQLNRQSEERAAVEGAWLALRDEAAALGESQQRVADDNAKLRAKLDEVTRQLEQTRSESSALAGLAADLDRERLGRRQAEASVAATVSECERRLSDQAIQFSESINKLEQQLATANDVQQSLERVRGELLAERDAADAQNADQSRRILELEARYAATEDRAAKLEAERAATPALSEWRGTIANVSQPVDAVAKETSISAKMHAESAVPEPTDAAAEFNWSSTLSESFSHKPAGDDARWTSATGTANEWSTVNTEAPTADGAENTWGQSPATDGARDNEWFQAAEPEHIANDPMPWGGELAQPAAGEKEMFGEAEAASASPLKPAAWPAAEEASSQVESGDDARQGGTSSAWNRPAVKVDAAANEPVSTHSEETFNRATTADNEITKKPESTSFIERYAHMFADDESERENKLAPLNQPSQASESAPSKARAMGVTRSVGNDLNLNKSGEEESIEQYMAKLLQRVRGDSSVRQATFVPQAGAPLNKPTPVDHPRSPMDHPRSSMQSSPLMAPAATIASNESVSIEPAKPVQRAPVKRTAATPAPATNLGALRALANETARRAISRHELRKHRRNAVTKVIVSTLAGVTSLWLMLDSPDWRTVQFITACVSLLVAAIWAGETYRTLLESLHAAAYDGPAEGLDESEAVPPPALPIDVESEERR
jgi:hypothetical protein